MADYIPLQVFKSSSKSPSMETISLSTPVYSSADSIVPPPKPTRKFGVYHDSTKLAQIRSLAQQDNHCVRSKYSLSNHAVMRVMFAEVERPRSWNGTPSELSGRVPSRCASEEQLSDSNYGFRPLSTFVQNGVYDGYDSNCFLSDDSSANFCMRSHPSVKLSRFTGEPLKIGHGSSYSVNVEVFSGPEVPKNDLCLTSEVALNVRKPDEELDGHKEPTYMNLEHFRSVPQVLVELMDTTSTTHNMEEGFVLANAFADQVLQYKWISTFPHLLPPPGWKQVQKVLLVCLHNVSVPSPRELLFAEFPDFSRDQVTLFNRIFHTFTDEDSGLFRLQELTFLMSRLGNPLDTLSLIYIFEQADKTTRGNILVGEFIELFRLACQDKLFDALDVFKMIAQQCKAHSHAEGTLMVVRDVTLQTEVRDDITQTETNNTAPRGVRERLLNTVRSAFSYITSKFH